MSTGEVAIDARIPAAVPLVRTQLPALNKIPHLFIMDTLGGIGPAPELLVDLSETQHFKEDLLAIHNSQVEWMRIAYGDDYIANARGQAALRATGTGFAYAEGFRSLATYPSTGGPELLPHPWAVA